MPNLIVAVYAWIRSACYPRGNFYPISDGNSILYRRITKPYFRICLTCKSRSQAPLCLYTLRMISNHSEGTFGRLRYNLGGDRPSQTAHLTWSAHLIKGAALEFRKQRGGISKVAPHKLGSVYHSLPPILYDYFQKSVSGYSKALRGLSVQSRVIRIFTYTTISPGPLLRQRPNHYAIRAGRNLPDKEFRYLRTVIVTAAVHWGLSSLLWI